MYLELSARQTGKTTRLIRQLIDDLENRTYQRAVIVTSNRNITSHIRQFVPRFLINSVMFNPSVGLARSVGESDLTRLYFDEFCYMSTEYTDIISPNGYYVSTPRSGIVMTETIKQLIEHNSGKYESHTNENMPKDSWVHYSRHDIDWQCSLESLYNEFPPTGRDILPDELFQI